MRFVSGVRACVRAVILGPSHNRWLKIETRSLPLVKNRYHIFKIALPVTVALFFALEIRPARG